MVNSTSIYMADSEESFSFNQQECRWAAPSSTPPTHPRNVWRSLSNNSTSSRWCTSSNEDNSTTGSSSSDNTSGLLLLSLLPTRPMRDLRWSEPRCSGDAAATVRLAARDHQDTCCSRRQKFGLLAARENRLKNDIFIYDFNKFIVPFVQLTL